MTLPGIDVSSFQDAPGRWMPLAGKIEWAAVKFTELSAAGAYTDPVAAEDWAALKAAGMGRVAYLFGHPGMSASRTVGLFLAALGKTLANDDGVALDLEVTDGLSPAAVSGWAQDVCGLLRQETGRPPIVYTFRDFALAGYCAGLGGHPLWIADPDSQPGKPRVPPRGPRGRCTSTPSRRWTGMWRTTRTSRRCAPRSAGTPRGRPLSRGRTMSRC